jgi:prepilin peptidase CpaA
MNVLISGISVIVWVVLAACAVAAITDLRTRRIPNALSLGLAALVLVCAATHGLFAFLVAAGIYAGVMVLGLLAFSAGWLGGGDVKLAAAAAAAFGYPGCVAFLLYMSLGGGILAIVVAMAKGRLSTTVSGTLGVLRPFAFRGVAATPPSPSSIRLPYACAIAFGATVVALANSVAPILRLPL